MAACPSGNGLAGDGEKDTHGREGHDERRPAVAEEGQGDAGQGQQLDDHADVDEGLERQPGRDAHRHEAAEGVGSMHGDADAPPGQEQEEGDDEEAADEAELLADDGEDEVVLGRRERQAGGLAALPEPLPEDTAESQGVEAVHRLVAIRGGHGEGVEERLPASHLVGVQEQERGHAGDAHGHHEEQLPAGCHRPRRTS